jgi:Undecaprenyl-phosphate glucose phosphotransferase
MAEPWQVANEAGYESARRSTPLQLLSYRTFSNLIAIFDGGMIVAISLFAAIAYHFVFLSEFPLIRPYLSTGIVAAIIFCSLTASAGLYNTAALLSWRRQTTYVLSFWLVVLLVLGLVFFLLKVGSSYSRGSLITFAILGFGLLLGSRFVALKILNDAMARGLFRGNRAILVGDHESLENLSRLEVLRKSGAREVARFELPPSEHEFDLTVLDKAIEAARLIEAESVLLALKWGDASRRNFVCERLQALPIPVWLLPDPSISQLLSRPLRQSGSGFLVEIQRAPLSILELALKRTIDLVLGGLLIVGLAPLMVVVGLLIKLDSQGPVLFCQARKGFNGRVFDVYKFRTMTVLENGDAVRAAERNDPRVTRLGRILRATSIDELPQLVNVLRGQMSLVGPRPHAVAHDDGYGKLIANYAFRQHVKPGLSGWAQINGFRGSTIQIEQMERRVALDLWYIKNWSFFLDLKIVLLTCVELLRGRDAY